MKVDEERGACRHRRALLPRDALTPSFLGNFATRRAGPEPGYPKNCCRQNALGPTVKRDVLTGAPFVVNRFVIVGMAGAELGARGCPEAYDPETPLCGALTRSTMTA